MTDAIDPQPALGGAIRRIRKRKGLKQEELAHLADLHATWVSKIEKGRTNPTWGTVRRLAAVLDVTLVELAATAERIELE